CPWEEDIADARRIAAQLKIPFAVIDVREAYRKRVVDVLEAEYAAGRTPNPDILCNREMKFGLLLELAKDQGFDAVATGHYAQIKSVDGELQLHRAADEHKDQTYFLWTLTNEQLPFIRFPIGHLHKDEVRAEAERRGIVVAAKPDSQGVCFLGPVSLRSYLKERLQTKPGEIILEDGTVIGTHEGIELYTIGQRHGLTFSGQFTGPYFVSERRQKTNQLVVSEKPPVDEVLCIEQCSWLAEPTEFQKIQARIRHGQQPQSAVALLPYGLIDFDSPQTAVASGQSVVCSDGTRILGGGIIV
ncbi:MAG: tRNA 2-thiouridine(34) synthase MnmA, partial [Patescibacteria group bacterium]